MTGIRRTGQIHIEFTISKVILIERMIHNEFQPPQMVAPRDKALFLQLFCLSPLPVFFSSYLYFTRKFLWTIMINKMILFQSMMRGVTNN